MRMADSTSSPKPTAGSIALRRAAPAKKSRAQMIAITARTVLAGRTAFTSVYEAPVVTAPRWEKSMPLPVKPVRHRLEQDETRRAG